jgi:hypothetical protein
MEVVLGFAVGYWVGTRRGREGLQEAIDSARAIWESPETKRMFQDGLSALERTRKHGDTTTLLRGVVRRAARAA